MVYYVCSKISSFILLLVSPVLTVVSYWVTGEPESREAYYTMIVIFSIFFSSVATFSSIYFCRICFPQNQLLKRWQLFHNVHFKRNDSLKQKLLTIDKDFPTLEKITDIEDEAKKTMNKIVKTISKECEDDEPLDLMLSGSAGERLNIPLTKNCQSNHEHDLMTDKHALLSDYDFMICNNFRQASITSERKYHIMIEDTPLGFAKLYCNMTHSIISAKEIKRKIYNSVMKMPYRFLPGLSSGKVTLRKRFFNSLFSVFRITRKGPSIRIQHLHIFDSFLVDIAFSIKTIEWPTNSDWPTRERKWPSEDLVEKIVQEGYHLVPKSHPEDKKEVTWRFSFSKAEVTLRGRFHPVR